jgi:hypothetical protein
VRRWASPGAIPGPPSCSDSGAAQAEGWPLANGGI